MKTYKTTKEECQNYINNNNHVCDSCGGKIEPIETVDNSDSPTFWAACNNCGVFTYGTTQRIFDICKHLVIGNGYVPYSHLGSIPDKSSDEYNHWIQSQIRGTKRVVLDVIDLLEIHK